MSVKNSYDQGDRVRLRAQFVRDGVNVAPGSVILKVKNPAGVETQPVLTNPSSGVYVAEVDVDLAGTWTYGFFSDGANKGAAEKAFFVKDSSF
jgi:hypothetical protein